jgi:hypothetical protein
VQKIMAGIPNLFVDPGYFSFRLMPTVALIFPAGQDPLPSGQLPFILSEGSGGIFFLPIKGGKKVF